MNTIDTKNNSIRFINATTQVLKINLGEKKLKKRFLCD